MMNRCVLKLLCLGCLSCLVVVSAALAAPTQEKRPRILCITTTAGFRHGEGIEASKKVLPRMAEESGAFEIEISESTEKITEAGLKAFDAVFFNNTTGDLDKFPLDSEGRDALIDFVDGGGAFIGTHAATDTFKDWPDYYEMIGGSFKGHPWGAGGPPVTIDVEDPSHPSAIHLDPTWEIQDEIYWFKNYSRDRIHVILSLNEESLRDKNIDPSTDVAVAWCRDYGKGRVFYTSLGHRGDVWTNPVYQKHLLEGIRWALGQSYAYVQPGHGKRAGEWTRIFDGKSLIFGTDWEASDDPDQTRKHWTVQPDGILQGYQPKGAEGPGSSHLYYVRKPYRNFEYRAEVRLEPGGNSGMYFRCPKDRNYRINEAAGKRLWKNWPDGDEAQVKVGPGDPKKTGTLYPGKPAVSEEELNAFLGVDTAAKPIWIQQHIIAVGDHIVIKLNGKVIRDRERMRHPEGLFAYQLHHPGYRVQYRNIEVRELFD